MSEETTLVKNKRLCKCGCSQQVIRRWRRSKKNPDIGFINGHNARKEIGSPHIGSDGYMEIQIRGRRYKLHRVIFEAYHKCRLLKWAVIHHRNGNKLDNSIENLEPIASTGKHMLYHLNGPFRPTYPYVGRKCIKCGTDRSKPNKLGVPNWFRFGGGYICDKCYHYEYLKRWRVRQKLISS